MEKPPFEDLVNYRILRYDKENRVWRYWNERINLKEARDHKELCERGYPNDLFIIVKDESTKVE